MFPLSLLLHLDGFEAISSSFAFSGIILTLKKKNHFKEFFLQGRGLYVFTAFLFQMPF